MQLTIERSALLKALGHVQSVVERRNTIPILSNVLLSAGRDRLAFAATDLDMEMVDEAEAQDRRRGPDHRPRPHPVRDRAQAAGRRRGLAELFGRRSAPGRLGRPVALQPAGPAGRRLPGHVHRQRRRLLAGRCPRRPGPPDRQDPVRGLDRRDPLLSERPVSPHGRRGRRDPAARRGHRRPPPGPGRNPGARGRGRPAPASSCRARRWIRSAACWTIGRRPGRPHRLGPEDPLPDGRGVPDLQGHRRRLPRLSARHPARQRQTGRHRQRPVRQGRRPRRHHLGREEPFGETGLRQRPREADRPQHGSRPGRGRGRDRLFRRTVRDRLQRPLPAGRRRPDHGRKRRLPLRRPGLARPWCSIRAIRAFSMC
jgi:hypothetical protein